MTTATSVLDPTAEPLLDEPDRRVCEIPTRAHADEPPPATWAISGVCSLCGAETLLACHQCKRRFERYGARCEVRGVRPVRITWMEPL